MLSPCLPDGTPPSSETVQGLATWALQYTPRVATSEEAVVLEVAASVRLFGGRRALHARLTQEAGELGVTSMAWAPNSLAAHALARAGIANGLRQPLQELLDTLPLDVLSATAPHRSTLLQLGCRTLGDLRRLPRGGISRRFDKALLSALDQAYGLRPEVHRWVELTESFYAKLELMARVDSAPAMLFGARRLLLQMSGWLAARHCGATAFTLHWAHDAMRARSAVDGGALTIRTAQPMRDVEHLCRLLAEHLQRVELQAPVGDLALEAVDVVPLEERSFSLLPDPATHGESVALALERIAARFGPQCVRRGQLVYDHRLEWMQHWHHADSGPHARPRHGVNLTETPQPTFLLAKPLRLAVRDHRPLYQGPLMLLAGPHRIEGGWWDRVEEGEGAADAVDQPQGQLPGLRQDQETRHVERDYWVALSEHAGLHWVFQERLSGDAVAWFLHGTFA